MLIQTRYTLMRATPTVRLIRYLAIVSITYNAMIAIKSSKILYSVLYGLREIDSSPGVFRYRIFLMSHGIPRDIKMANELAPSEFDTPTPPSFLRIIKTLDIPSGKQPPAAKNVNPITASGMFNV